MKTLKRMLGILLATGLMISTVMAADPISVVFNGETLSFDVPPQMINSRTMVPLRAIFEALGASVEWNGDTRTVTSVKEDVTICLTVDDTTMYINDEEKILDTPACIVENRTLVPVRAVSEAFGIKVDWIGETRTVVIGEAPTLKHPLFHDGLVQVYRDGKYGFINRSGEEVILPQYFNVSGFSDGVSAVCLDGKWGFINTKGEEVIPFQYDSAGGFFDGLASVMIDGKGGYINKAGELVIPPQFDYAFDFSEGLARVRVEGKYGFINTRGELVIAPQFEFAHDFSDGVATVQLNRTNYYIDKSGNYITPKRQGLTPAQEGGKEGYVDPNGTLVIPYQFDLAGEFSEGLAVVCVGGKFGYVNESGEMVIPPQFTLAERFSNGMAAVQLDDGYYGFINREGEMVIAPRFPVTTYFYDDGYAICYDEAGVLMIIDRNGNVIASGYDSIEAVLHG